jgi:hypothetical protein
MTGALTAAAALALAVVAGHAGQAQLLSGAGLAGSSDQGQVADAGVFDRLRVFARRRLGVGVPADDLRDGGARLPARPPHLQLGQVVGVEDEPGFPSGQERVDRVHVPLELDSGGLADQPHRRPAERCLQRSGTWNGRR